MVGNLPYSITTEALLSLETRIQKMTRFTVHFSKRNGKPYLLAMTSNLRAMASSTNRKSKRNEIISRAGRDWSRNALRYTLIIVTVSFSWNGWLGFLAELGRFTPMCHVLMCRPKVLSPRSIRFAQVMVQKEARCVKPAPLKEQGEPSL